MFNKTICKFKKSIGSGADREVFYSKKHDCVFKMPNREGCRFRMADYNHQTLSEKLIFNKMTKEQFNFFPIVDVIDYNGINVIVMKKCVCLGDLKELEKNFSKHFHLMCREDYSDLVNFLKIDNDVEEFFAFTNYFSISDLHFGNLGIYNNKLVILDAGY